VTPSRSTSRVNHHRSSPRFTSSSPASTIALWSLGLAAGAHGWARGGDREGEGDGDLRRRSLREGDSCGPRYRVLERKRGRGEKKLVRRPLWARWWTLVALAGDGGDKLLGSEFYGVSNGPEATVNIVITLQYLLRLCPAR
jgi:hypothetical protein